MALKGSTVSNTKKKIQATKLRPVDLCRSGELVKVVEALSDKRMSIITII